MPDVTSVTLRTEQALQQRADERVVRAAEDDRVDAGRAQRRAVRARELDVLLGDRRARLAHLRELRARDARQAHERVGREDGALVGAARDRRGRREHADPPVVGPRDREVGLRADDPDDVDVIAARATYSGRSSIALEVAELHAMTMSLTPRSSRMSAIWREKRAAAAPSRSP